MSEWMAITHWQDCAKMVRPGIVFEIRNAEGQRLITPCAAALPQMPWDWKSPPLVFRSVMEPKPEHSEPLPAPKT